ncbi:5'-nucleotidase C-terminal domain-containing protein [Maribellus maritimus]|uniref:5'-nucleotidase C-terminal domain-containing protein n=1 Tax=Maribellus maritimus TaxID=2870838 RepID=UPI001EECCF4B|nr:5'-nucleotidase [Maribellus maritimus]MCG6187563.1 5'-nucleotidase C-terminal domain-containing protein [Maribellus maritimus]
MQQTITYTLLITCVLLLGSCKTHYSKVSYETENLTVSESLNSLDNEVVQLYLPYKNILEKDMNRVISVSNIEMEKDKPESILTNFLADLLIEEGKKEAILEGLDFQPEISFYNYFGILSNIPEGKITVENIFELMPFENEMVFLQLTGEQIKIFLDIVASSGGDSVGGVRFKISEGKAERILVAGKPLNLNEKYWLVTNDYVANGGSSMQVFTQRLKMINTHKKIRNVIIKHLEDKQEIGEKLTAKTDGRISYE